MSLPVYYVCSQCGHTSKGKDRVVTDEVVRDGGGACRLSLISCPGCGHRGRVWEPVEDGVQSSFLRDIGVSVERRQH